MKGHNIYNGAVDNATGCGVLLEVARLWSETPSAPPRMILFAGVTAEEQGLLGSEYLGKHSPVPPGRISLDLNYDALAPIGDPEEMEVSGAERTTFFAAVEEKAKSFGLAIQPDTHPEAGYYYRSDHFSLARVGIPSFSISEGLKFKGHDEAWGEAQHRDYLEHRYHQPSDQYVPGMDFTGDAKLATFGYELGVLAVSQPKLIGWLPGDEFEAARQRSQTERSIFRKPPRRNVKPPRPLTTGPARRLANGPVGFIPRAAGPFSSASPSAPLHAGVCQLPLSALASTPRKSCCAPYARTPGEMPLSGLGLVCRL